MKKHLLMICIALSLGFTACDKNNEDAAADSPTEQANTQPAEKAAETETAEKTAEQAESEPAEKIELAAAGAKLDPSVKPEQLPEGAWYCDMGTVHWAAMEKPEDGKCPECGMALKEYAAADHAAQKAKAIDTMHDDHGHEHGDEEGHDHAHEEEGHAHDEEHGHEH